MTIARTTQLEGKTQTGFPLNSLFNRAHSCETKAWSPGLDLSAARPRENDVTQILICIAFTTALLVVANTVPRTRFGAGGVAAIFAVTALLFTFSRIFTAVLVAQSFLTCLFALACLVFRARPQIVFYGACAAAVASYALVVMNSLGELAMLRDLRQKYPLESLAGRLAYEKSAKDEAGEADDAPVPLSADVELRLQAQESELEQGSTWRRYMLERLHDHMRDAFVMARGFGPVRMRAVRPKLIELPEPEPVPLPPPPRWEYRPEQAPPPPMGDLAAAGPAREELLAMHARGLGDFLDPDRMGYVRGREQVAGFLPHQFARSPAAYLDAPTRATWRATRLELVSLLAHDEPVVYVSRHLPRMDELKNAPTRRLTPFEAQALPRLRREKDLVVEEGRNRIHMLGALRAGETCLQCHGVRRGELLGAFSYELIRERPLPEKPPREEMREPAA